MLCAWGCNAVRHWGKFAQIASADKTDAWLVHCAAQQHRKRGILKERKGDSHNTPFIMPLKLPC